MKVPLSWLRELVELDTPLPELRQRLTMAGLEVEDVHQVGSDWQDVTIGRIVELEPHPRRETLNVARVDLGGRTATVVTGAPNLHVGDIVPHVAPGGRLPAGPVGAREFGGITSEGMVCSGDELHISPDKDGIYIFEPEAPVGQPLEDFLSETILDIYITANRPDCMSMMGIAREVHALFGAPYTPAMSRLLDPATARVEGSPGEPPVRELLTVRIEDPIGCPRFTASVVRGIQIGASPHWLQRRLYFAGVRPISNVVDVTNYVMLEVGQPLHAFDRQRLGSSTIVVRRASEGERLRTLDGEDRKLSASMLVVADEQRARSLAGIMGGEDSEITDATREVVLEGASWDRASIRNASAALTLSTEASRRFGRGVDPDLTALGVARATQLTLELAGGAAAAGLADEYPGRESPRTIVVRPEQIDALIGMHYSPEQVAGTLDALGFPLVERGAGSGRHRARLAAVRRRGSRRHRRRGRPHRRLRFRAGDDAAGCAAVSPTRRRRWLCRRDASPQHAGRGWFAGGHHLLADRSRPGCAAVGRAGDNQQRQRYAIKIANPQSAELSVLRPRLLGSLLFAVRSNLRQRDRVLVFELARTWHGPLAPLPDERRHVGIVMLGPRSPRHFKVVDDSTMESGRSSADDNLDYFDVKGVVDTLCGAFRVPVTYVPSRHPSLHPGRTAEVHAAGQRRWRPRPAAPGRRRTVRPGRCAASWWPSSTSSVYCRRASRC